MERYIKATTPTNISYVRDAYLVKRENHIDWDLGYYLANTTEFDYTVKGLKPVLDPDDAYILLTLNAFGNNNRLTNDMGGTIYDGSDGSTVNYVIDHLSGLGWWLANAVPVSNTWQNASSTIRAGVFGGYSGWRMPTIQEWQDITIDNTTCLFNPIENWNAAIFWGMNTNNASTATILRQTNDYLSTRVQTFSTNANAAVAGCAVRNHYPNIAQPSVNTILYIRPAPDGVTTISLTGDSAWNLVNRPDTYVPSQYGQPAYLDPINPHKLLHNNIFGHKWRRTGENGGYYDLDTLQYKLADGTVSDRDTTFGVTGVGGNAYLIDHHTGLGWMWFIQGSRTFTLHISNIDFINTGAGWNGSFDWFLPNRNQLQSIMSFEAGAYVDVFAPFNSNNSVKTSTPFPGVETTQHFYKSNFNVVNRTDITNDGAYLCRYHFV